MWFKEDTTYQDMKRNAACKWLEETLSSEDLVNQHGAKITLEYIAHLKGQIKELEDKNSLKETYLKKLKQTK